MQIAITIAQTEIEDAIRAKVLEQISPKEGQEINIELRATRGPEGFTAIITIDNSDGMRAVPAPKKVITTGDLKRMQAEEAAAEAAQGEEAGTADGSEATEAGSDNGSETVVEEGEAAPAPVTPAPVAAAPAPVKKRLFGNVVKPNNA